MTPFLTDEAAVAFLVVEAVMLLVLAYIYRKPKK